MIKNLKSVLFILIPLLGFILLSTTSSFSQNNPLSLNSTLQSSSEDIVVYDADADRYLFYRKETGGKGLPYKILSREEYQQERLNKTLRESWQQKRDEDANAITGREGGGLFPTRFRIKNETLENIFG